MSVKTDYTREELIELCERAVVEHDKWDDRDSASAHEKIGTAWVYLKAGCPFEVVTKGLCATDEDTIWVAIRYHGFSWFEGDDCLNSTSAYIPIPTPARLERAKSEDWY